MVKNGGRVLVSLEVVDGDLGYRIWLLLELWFVKLSIEVEENKEVARIGEALVGGDGNGVAGKKVFCCR